MLLQCIHGFRRIHIEPFTHFTERRVNFLLKGHIQAGRLPGLRWEKRRHSRGYVLTIE